MESDSWTSGNSYTISQAIFKLFSILSTWNRDGNSLTLEISAQPLGDSKHWFKNRYFGADGEDKDIISESGNILQETSDNFHDPNHGWVNGQQIATSDGLAMLRLYESVELRFQENLSEVHAVKGFVLRR